MPFGSFLDSFPSILFICAHVLFLAVGVWAARKAQAQGMKFASAIWLYAISQIFFLAFFGDIITMKMAVLVEQTMMVIMVYMIVSKK